LFGYSGLPTFLSRAGVRLGPVLQQEQALQTKYLEYRAFGANNDAGEHVAQVQRPAEREGPFAAG